MFPFFTGYSGGRLPFHAVSNNSTSFQTRACPPRVPYYSSGACPPSFHGGYTGRDQFMRNGHGYGGYQNVRLGYNNGGYGGYGGSGSCGGIGGGFGFTPRTGWFQTANGPVYVGFNTYLNSINNALNGLYGGHFAGLGGLGNFGGGFSSLAY